MMKYFLTMVFFIFFLSPLSVQSAPEGQEKAAGEDRSAEEIVNNRCYLCHGVKGEGSSAIYPRIAGQHKEYIAKQLMDFRGGQRKGTMNEMVVDLTNEEIFSLAEYFDGQPTLTHKVRNKSLAAVGEYIFFNGNEYSGIEACATCHGATGKGDGAAAAAMNPKPRSFADGQFAYDTDGDGKAGTDADLLNILKNGTAAYGGSATMPGRADMTDAELADMVAYIRTLKN